MIFLIVPLDEHFENLPVDYLQFSFRWMNNLLMRELPLSCVIRLWDSYLVRGITGIVYNYTCVYYCYFLFYSLSQMVLHYFMSTYVLLC